MNFLLLFIQRYWSHLLMAFVSGWATYYLMNYMDENHELKSQAAVHAEVVQVLKRTNTATVEVLSKQVKTQNIIKERTRDVLIEIEKRIPADPSGCLLSPQFRLLHDASASNEPLPPAPEPTDARAVTAQEAARTIAENYEVCQLNAEQLRGLQQWIQGVSK